jgi:hypothetical protein
MASFGFRVVDSVRIVVVDEFVVVVGAHVLDVGVVVVVVVVVVGVVVVIVVVVVVVVCVVAVVVVERVGGDVLVVVGAGDDFAGNSGNV